MRCGFFLRPLVAALLIAAVFMDCDRQKERMPVASDEMDIPIQKFEGAVFQFFNKGRIQWRLDADSMARPVSDTGTIIVVPVRLLLYDTTGELHSKVFADTGRIGSDMQSYNIWGSVFIRTRDSMTVLTERLKWQRKRRRVESDTFVQIETKNGDVLRGKGLDATEDFSRFSFKSDVTGKFPDFQRRMESTDESVF